MRLKTTYISIPGLLILFISLFCHSPLTAQETSHLFYEDKIEFEHIGEEQGVTKVLQCVFQDSKGFLWFGSAINGLYRYNGYEFKQYLHDFRDKSSLSDNNIDRVFLEDSSGDFWFNADGELSRYNRMSDNFSHFVQDPDNKFSIGPGMVESVIQDKDGLIWIRSAGDGPGLSVYDRSKSSFKHLYHNAEDPESINSNDIDVIFLDDSGFLWIAFAKLGVERFEPEEGNLTKVTSREFSVAVTSMSVHQFDAELAIQVLKEMKRIASRLILMDYNYPLVRSINRSAIYSIEWMAGGDHWKNFKKYNQLGGLDYFLAEAGLSITKEIHRSTSFRVLECQ